ncbi:MAG: YceI family protein [Desulfobaccales bacterium]
MAKWLTNTFHSAAIFSVRHLMVTWVVGMFPKISGSLDFDPLNVEGASVAVAIEAASVFTGVADRDEHLQSPDFLDVAQYPTITFKSIRVEAAGLDHAWVHGDLTLHGVTRQVMLDVHWAGPAHLEDQGKVYTTFGFQAKTRINREDFGITYNNEMGHGGVGIGRQVYLTLNCEADLAEAEK